MKHVSKFHLALSHHTSPSCQIVEFWPAFGLKMLEFLEGEHVATRRTHQLLQERPTLELNPGLSCYEATANHCTTVLPASVIVLKTKVILNASRVNRNI